MLSGRYGESRKGERLQIVGLGLCMENVCRPDRLGLGTSLGCSLLIQAKSYIALPLTTVHLYILASMLIEELFSLS